VTRLATRLAEAKRFLAAGRITADLIHMRFSVMGMLALAGLILVAGGITSGLRAARNRLVVENRSGQPIVRLEVSMRSVPVATFHNLSDGAEGSATFRVVGDNSLDLSGALADGTRVRGNFGYFTTGGYGERPRFIVRRGGQIDFTQ
jgi:hypothetical protein